MNEFHINTDIANTIFIVDTLMERAADSRLGCPSFYNPAAVMVVTKVVPAGCLQTHRSPPAVSACALRTQCCFVYIIKNTI